MMEIDIIVSEDVADLMPVDVERLREYALAILSRSGLIAGEVNIVFIGDEFMAELNETYKGREGTTDVLSFNLTDELAGGLSGEVYVSLERARSQADELGVSFEEEVVRLVTHGLLHLAGHVHDTEEQHRVMTERTETLVGEFFSARGEK
jgi:probable rRNA maturation factor